MFHVRILFNGKAIYTSVPKKLTARIITYYDDLDGLRNELDEWYHLALSHADTSYDETENRAQFIEFYDELLYLIEAMYFFTRDKKAAHRREELLSSEFRGSDNQPQILSLDSVADPLPYIRDFCIRIPLHYVRIEVWDFFEATGIYRGNLEIKVDISRMFRLYLDVMVLVEAAYIISRKTNIQ